LRYALGIIDKVSIWTAKVVAFMILPLIAVIVIGVIWRYALHQPLEWTQELAQFIFGGIGVLIGASLIQGDAHIKVETIQDRLPEKGKAILITVGDLVVLFFLVILLWQGADSALYSIRMLEHSWSTWGPVIYPIKTVIPIAAFLMLIQQVAKFVRDLYFTVHGRKLQ
jgi:TRAP-type mannitol/chloroaromatic compound transport system permease small subunit